MNKTELIDAMASKTGLTKKNAEAALNAFVETVSEQLASGDKISLVGFVSFLKLSLLIQIDAKFWII